MMVLVGSSKKPLKRPKKKFCAPGLSKPQYGHLGSSALISFRQLGQSREVRFWENMVILNTSEKPHYHRDSHKRTDGGGQIDNDDQKEKSRYFVTENPPHIGYIFGKIQNIQYPGLPD